MINSLLINAKGLYLKCICNLFDLLYKGFK